jgi:hypothetical protein
MITKHSQTKYFVLKPGVALPTPGTTLYNTTTEAININKGVGGFYKPVAGSGNHNEITTGAGTGTMIKFIFRRTKDGDRSPLYNRAYDESAWINSNCFNGTMIQGKAAELPTNNAWLVGNNNVNATTIATTGALQILDETTYKLQVSGHGDRTDLYNGVYNTPTTFGYYTTPDLSATTLNDAQKQDLIIQSLIENFNSKSASMSFAICIDSRGTATNGTPILDFADGTIPVGTSTVIGYTCEGNPVNFILSVEYVQAFQAIEDALVASGVSAGVAELVPYLTPTTSNPPAGVPVAGTTARVDFFAILAIDEGQAYYDYRMATKRNLTVGLSTGFVGTAKVEATAASEGAGIGRNLKLAFENNNGYEETARPKAFQAYHVEFPNEVLADAFYDIIYIEHCQHRTATSGMPMVNNHTTAIAIVNFTIGDATTNPYYTGVANAQLTTILANINEYITNNNIIIDGATLTLA